MLEIESGEGEVMSPYIFTPCYDPIIPGEADPNQGRDACERAHQNMLNFHFLKPFIMTPSALQRRLPLLTMHKSCNKACAIYCVPEISIDWRRAIFELVYWTWFVRNESELCFGAFAAQLIGCWAEESPKSVEGILEAHMKLCLQIEGRQKTLDPIDGLLPSTTLEVRRHINFELTPSFRSVVIIIDKEDWRKEGVLLLRTSDEAGLEIWPVERCQKEWPEMILTAKSHGRYSLKDAVFIVCKMQREIETEEAKARRLAPVNTHRHDQIEHDIALLKK